MTDEPFDYPGFKPPSPLQPQQNPLDRFGLAVTSLSLGFVGVVISFIILSTMFGMYSLFIVIGFIGLAGVILGIMGLRGGANAKQLAGWGIGLSIAASLVGLTTHLISFNEFSHDTELKWDMWIGKPAPDLDRTDLDGNSIQLSQYKSKRIVLNFFATWYPPSVEEISHFVTLRKILPQDQFIVLSISDDPPEELRTLINKYNINYPIISTMNLPEPYDSIMEYPTTIFIDRNGIIQNVLEGYHDFDELRENAVTDDYVAQSEKETGDDASEQPDTPEETPTNEQ